MLYNNTFLSDKELFLKLHWLNYWMMLHASLFWLLVFLSIYKILGRYDVEWGTLFQWWWWNLFAYLYVAFVHFIVVNREKFMKDDSAAEFDSEMQSEPEGSRAYGDTLVAL